MYPSTFGTWTCCLRQQKTQRSDWGSSHKVSVSDPRSGCRASQHFTSRREKWRLAAQADPSNYPEKEASWPESYWRSNYPSLREHTERVKKVLEDPTSRGQLIKLPEDEAKARYPNLVFASLGSNRKDKPNGEISARVLFDGTNGLQVNTRTRLRDQERSPIVADLKRAVREKATLGVRTFALTADVKEAHRQVPIHPRDWHLLGCRVEAGTDVYINTVGTFGVASASTGHACPRLSADCLNTSPQTAPTHGTW